MKRILVLFCLLLFFAGAWPLQASAATISLTEAEQAFLQAHPVIRLGVDPAFVPYEFIDTDGVYKGIAADYIALIEERTGLSMEVAPDLTWTEAYEMAARKELDVLPCVSRTVEREQYFLFSQAYYNFRRVIAVADSNQSIKSFEDLFGRSVGVQARSSHHGFLMEYGEISLNLYPTVVEGLLAVSSGREESFVGNLATTSYLLKTNGITGLKLVEVQSDEPQSLFFAVRDDWPELVTILNKGLASITKEERLAINERWIGVEPGIDYTWISQLILSILGIFALVLSVSIFWIQRLKGEIALRKQAEAELRIAKEEAESANRIKSTFLARMSHEIRTPLNAITGMSYLLKKTGVTPAQKSYLDKITQAARNMLGIINDILDFSKIESGKIDIESVPFQLDKVLQTVIGIASFNLEEKSIAFNAQKDPDLPDDFVGDPTRISQILLNLLNNAIKFTDEGSVSLSVDRAGDAEGKTLVEFRIEDTGIGMTQEQVDQLFQPFQQADATISRRFGGTGLGLSIAKNLTEMMGGTIRVESEAGRGSAFMVRLPLQANDSPERRAEAETVHAYFRRLRALALVKDPREARLLRSYFESFQLPVDFMDTEDQLRAALAAGNEAGKETDLVLVDQEAPAAGGLVFCAGLRQKRLMKSYQKCILLIPLQREDLFDQLEKAGIDMGVSKPVIPSILYNAILEIFHPELRRIHEDESEAESPSLQADGRDVRVLLVEDNRTNQLIAGSILRQAGFQVEMADNGKQGVDMFLADPSAIDIILMDLHMPVMNGFDAAAKIRETDQEVPIIALTADAIAGVEEACRAVGIGRYISKPFEPEEFVAAVIAAVRKPPVLDRTVGLRNLGGDPALYEAVLSVFREENAATGEAMARAVADMDLAAVEGIAHKIKSSAASIGALALSNAAAALQNAAQENDIARIRTDNETFQAVLQRLLAEGAGER